MKFIDMNRGTGYKYLKYPDGQPHVNIADEKYLPNDEIVIICSITNPEKLFVLSLLKNVLDQAEISNARLIIPYLMCARFDRVMQHGDSFDLKVIAGFINAMNFKSVSLIDVHSDVSTALINNSRNQNNWFLVRKYLIPDSVLICPDAGAVKKVAKYLEWNPNIIDVVYCTKTRDLSNGKLNIKVLEPEKCKDKKCIIIDDLCDGGGTFLGIASQIPTHKDNLTLIITHGIFSQGFDNLGKHFGKIMTTDSYPFKGVKPDFVEVYPCC